MNLLLINSTKFGQLKDKLNDNNHITELNELIECILLSIKCAEYQINGSLINDELSFNSI